MNIQVVIIEHKCGIMMKTLMIAPSCDPRKSAMAVRVWSFIRMMSSFSCTDVLVMDNSELPNSTLASVNHHHPKENLYSKIMRLSTFYKSDYKEPSISKDYDVIQMVSLHVYSLRRFFNEVPIILDENNVFWNMYDFEIRNTPFFKNFKNGGKDLLLKTIGKWLLERAKKFELNAINNSNHVITTSKEDKQEIVKMCPDKKESISVIPSCIDTREIRPKYLERKNSRKNVLFMGAFNYFPNVDAIRIICDEIAPQLEDVDFTIIGGFWHPGLPKYSNVQFPGFVQCVDPYIQKADICIAPLRYGSGTRIKILEYMAMGKPIVSTQKGAEGLEYNDGQDIVIENNFTQFKEAILRLLKDPNEANSLGKRARKLAEMKYDWRIYAPHLKKIFLDEI